MQPSALTVQKIVDRVGSWAMQAAVFAGSFVVFYAIGRLLLDPIVQRSLSHRGLDIAIRRLLLRLFRVVYGFAALVGALSVAGFGEVLNASATVAGALTLAIGFAARDLLANLTSGVFIISDQKFGVGDWIEWNDRQGVVEDIAFRVTRIRTFENELVTVPNATLTNSDVLNAVEYSPRRISHEFVVDRDNDVAEVSDLLLAEARTHEEILAEPRPKAHIVDFSGSTLRLQVHFWVSQLSRERFMRIRSEYIRRVKARFDTAEITTP